MDGVGEDLASALPRLRAHLVRRGHGADADDLTQEAAVRALRYGARYDGKRGLWPWLRRLVDRVQLDHWRAGQRGPEVRGGLSELELVAPESKPSLDLRDEVARVVSRLGPRERDAMLRFYVEQQSIEEIAVALGVPAGTVKSHLSRARRRLAAAAVLLFGAGALLLGAGVFFHRLHTAAQEPRQVAPQSRLVGVPSPSRVPIVRRGVVYAARLTVERPQAPKPRVRRVVRETVQVATCGVVLGATLDD